MSLFGRYSHVTAGTERRPWFLALVVIAALLISGVSFVPTYAQLQQSGGGGSNASVGSTGSAPPGSATLAGGSVTTSAPTYTTGQMSALSLNTSGGLRTDGSGVTQPVSGTVSINALPAGTNAIGTVLTRPNASCGSTAYDSAITTVPTTEAAATSTATCVDVIYCNNLTASSQVFSIKDNAATPVVIVNGFNLPGNSNILLSFGGIKFNLGVRWVATNASAVNCQIKGNQ